MSMSRLRLLRLERGLTLSEVAAETGVSDTTISNAERSGAISAGNRKALADFYGVTVAYLLGTDEAAA